MQGIGRGEPDHPTYEYGTTYILSAGLIGLLIMLDAFDVRRGSKAMIGSHVAHLRDLLRICSLSVLAPGARRPTGARALRAQAVRHDDRWFHPAGVGDVSVPAVVMRWGASVAWLLAGGYMALIFGLSSLSAPPVPSGVSDVAAHVPEFGLLAWLLARASPHHSLHLAVCPCIFPLDRVRLLFVPYL